MVVEIVAVDTVAGIYLYDFFCSLLLVSLVSSERQRMAATSKDYRYTVEFNIHVVDAPGTRLKQTGDLYINICLLGIHKRTRLTPPYLPIHFDQRLHFEKVSYWSFLVG